VEAGGKSMRGETENVMAAIEAIEALLARADGLRRDDCQSLIGDWTDAVRRVLVIFDACPISTVSASIDALLAARSAVRRLADSGEARCVTASAGRKPDSSHAGRRFRDDVERVEKCLKRLREIAGNPE
jgi:hypothetical protein